MPFKHLVVVAQAARFDEREVARILERSSYAGVDRGAVAERLHHVERWLATFAPEDMRFVVADTLPAASRDLDADQRRFLGLLAARLEPGMDGETVHATIYTGPGASPLALLRAIVAGDGCLRRRSRAFAGSGSSRAIPRPVWWRSGPPPTASWSPEA